MDPFAGLADFVLGKLKQSAMAQWWRLLFELVSSGVLSFLRGFALAVAGMGASNLSGATRIEAALVLVLGLGAGAGWAALSMTSLLRSEQAKLLRGMTFVLPGEEAAAELNANLQTIHKSEK